MLEHWIWLATRQGIGCHSQRELLNVFDDAEDIYNASRDEVCVTKGFQESWMVSLSDKDLSGAFKILEDCDAEKIKVLAFRDPLYPECLRNIVDPPSVLYYRGTLPDLNEEVGVAIVGTRACSAYGLLHAKQFSKLIANSGGIVISGGARGIDTMAIKGALDSSMPVICVLGGAINRPYPRENRWLFREVEMHGCLISEYPPGMEPNRKTFPQRNRLMSGMSVATLIVEAPIGSGALITANHALDQGRDVYTIPGNIGMKQCEGNNELLRQGAQIVMNGWDLLGNYAWRFPEKLADARNKEALEKVYSARYGMSLPVFSPRFIPEEGEKKAVDKKDKDAYSKKKEPPTQLSEDEKLVLAMIKDTPEHVDQLMAQASIPPARVTAALTMLLIKQLIEKQSGNYYVRK